MVRFLLGTLTKTFMLFSTLPIIMISNSMSLFEEYTCPFDDLIVFLRFISPFYALTLIMLRSAISHLATSWFNWDNC
jgi:hypothetical protein